MTRTDVIVWRGGSRTFKPVFVRREPGEWRGGELGICRDGTDDTLELYRAKIRR
jgi:hypothetical protein